LKLATRTWIANDTYVAPRAGAWVETKANASRKVKRPVAPRAGAWVETRVAAPIFLREQGVAPRAGAWVETRTSCD